MENKRWEIWVFALVVLFILYIAKKRGEAIQPPPAVATNPNGTGIVTPGMLNTPEYMNSATQPIATPGNVNIRVSVNPWSLLDQQYMPLFGFVGVVN